MWDICEEKCQQCLLDPTVIVVSVYFAEMPWSHCPGNIWAQTNMLSVWWLTNSCHKHKYSTSLDHMGGCMWFKAAICLCGQIWWMVTKVCMLLQSWRMSCRKSFSIEKLPRREMPELNTQTSSKTWRWSNKFHYYLFTHLFRSTIWLLVHKQGTDDVHCFLYKLIVYYLLRLHQLVVIFSLFTGKIAAFYGALPPAGMQKIQIH